MAVTVDELVLKVTLSNEKTAAELERISSELKDLQKNTKKAADGTSDFTASFAKLSVAGYAAIRSIQTAITGLTTVTSSFFEAQDAVTKLNQALEISGTKNIPEVSDQFLALADSIEQFGVASAEQVLGLAKIGFAAGNSATQVEQLVKTAADLSVARDVPIDSAFRALSATLKGSAGALSSFIPELKNLTDEQARAGKAIEYVNSIIGGFAARNVETYAGKVAILKTKLGDVGEEIGRIISDILEFNKSVGSTSSYLDSMKKLLIENRDLFVDFGKFIIEIFKRVASAILDITMFITSLISGLKEGLGRIVQGFGFLNSVLEKATGLNTGLGDDISAFGKAMADTAKATREAAWETLNYTASQDKAAESIKTVNKALAERKDAKVDLMTPEQVQVWESLKSKVIEFHKAEVTAGKEGADLIRAKLQSSLEEISIMETKLKLNRKLNDEQRKALADARAALNKGSQLELDKLHAENLQKIQSKNEEILTATKSIDATRREQIQYELDAQLKLLEIEKKKLDIKDKASRDAIEAQKKLLQEQAQKKADQGPSERYEAAAKAGTVAAKAITEVFTKGVGEVFGGALSAFGTIVDVISAGLDILPNLMNNIAGIFNKITDFPDVLLSAFSSVFDSITRFVSEFIPKLMNFIPSLLENLDKFIIGFIDAFKQLLISFPQILTDMIDKLPEIVQSLISNIISSFPDIISSFVAFLIEKGPGIVWKIFRAVILDIPKAIVNGIIEGIKKVGKIIANLLTGKGLKLPKVQIDGKSIQDSMKKLSGNAARLFNVSDMLDAAKDPLDAVTQGIEDAAKKARDYIMEAWKWVYEKIIQPIFDGLKAVWMWVYEKVVQPIFDGLKAVWMWVYKNVIQPVIDAFMALWNWVYSNILKPIADAFYAVFDMFRQIAEGFVNALTVLWSALQAIWDKVVGIGEAFGKALLGAWQWVKENIIDKIAGAITGAWEWVRDNIFGKIGNFIIDAFNWVRDNIFNADMFLRAFQKVIDFFQGLGDQLGKAIWEAIKGIGDQIAQAIKDIIPGGGGGGLEIGGDLGKAANKVKKALGLASGGLVYAQNGLFVPNGTDTVPSMLTPGEFVVNRAAVNTLGIDTLQQINKGKMPSGGVYNISFEINIDAKTNLDESFIRGTLVPRMQDELKRASLDGKFVLSAKGIR